MKTRWFLNIFLGLIFFISSFLWIGCDSSINSGEILIKAEELIKNGKNEAAIEILRPYIYKNNNSFEAHLLIGQALLNLNINDNKNLYLARHYFNKASKLAPNENQRRETEQTYADLILSMGKKGKSADTLLKAANRASTIGNSEQAIKLYLQAANLFIQDEKFVDAIKSCQQGLWNNPDKGNKFVLSLTMSRAMFLKKDYKDCSDTCLSIEDANTEIPLTYLYEAEFLKVASNFMLVERKRNYLSLNPLKKEFPNENEQDVIKLFDKSLDCLKKFDAFSTEDQKFLIGQYSLFLARHSIDCDLKDLSKKAYEYSRRVFYQAGFEDEAFVVGKEISANDG
jgi:tetratricopeptide (TPR) repeat protein